MNEEWPWNERIGWCLLYKRKHPIPPFSPHLVHSWTIHTFLPHSSKENAYNQQMMSEWGWNDLEMRESGDVSYIRDSTGFPRQKTSASCITWKEVNLGVWMTFRWGMRWKWQKWRRNDEMKVGWGIFFIQGFRLRSKIPPHFTSIRHSDIILGRHLS